MYSLLACGRGACSSTPLLSWNRPRRGRWPEDYLDSCRRLRRCGRRVRHVAAKAVTDAPVLLVRGAAGTAGWQQVRTRRSRSEEGGSCTWCERQHIYRKWYVVASLYPTTRALQADRRLKTMRTMPWDDLVAWQCLDSAGYDAAAALSSPRVAYTAEMIAQVKYIQQVIQGPPLPASKDTSTW